MAAEIMVRGECEVRGGAAGDARRRAAAYAAGLGGTIGDVTWMAEPGLRQGASARSDWLGAGPGSAEPDDGTVAVTPAEITLSATIEVGFELRHTEAPPSGR